MKPATNGLDLEAIRAAFPGLDRKVHGKRLVYLDSAATAQRAQAALDEMDRYHRGYNANVHRGLYTTSEEATAAYERVRGVVARFLGVADSNRVVFTRGTTESVNLVARGFLAPLLDEGDVVLVTEMEHHSNIVPWQLVAAESGARVEAVRLDGDGNLDLDDLRAKLGPRTKMLAISHASNVLGTVNPVREIVALAHAAGIPVFVDGAQSAPHLRVDLEELGADFFAFSGHKLFGPTGSGALCAGSEQLAAMQPVFGGGDMIREVHIESSTFADPPQRFEAGTPNIAATLGMGAAIEWLGGLDSAALHEYEAELLEDALSRMEAIDGARFFGAPRERIAVAGFEVEGLNSQDVATLLDHEGVAVRAGHHCAQPLMRVLGVTGCLRLSLAAYNSSEDIDVFVSALEKVCRVLRG